VSRLLFSIGIILSGLSFGYIVQRLVEAGLIRLPFQMETLRRVIQRVALQFFTPIPVIGAIWLIRIDDLRMMGLPFLCVAILLFGGFLGWTVGRAQGYGPKQIGALFSCGSFSNIASIGSLVTFLFIGEEGFAMLALYKLFEEITYFGIGFPIARYYGLGLKKSETITGRLRTVFADPFVIVAISALTAGLVLNISGIPRPAFYEKISAVFIPFGAFALLVSIGMGMSFGRVGFLKDVLLMSGIKFVAMPGLACMVAVLLGMQTLKGGLPMKAVLLGSSMPVAFNSVVASSLFELDLDLANSCWLVTTGAMVIVLPCLYYLLEHI
jgi:predicted permease